MKSLSKISPAPLTDRRGFISRSLEISLGLAMLAVSPALRAQGRGMTAMPLVAGKSAVSPAPTLRLADGEGGLIDLHAYRGKVVLVNFWATWCPPCRKEFPSLGRVRALFPRDAFEVLAVNVGEDPETVFSFAIPEFPMLFDRDSKAMAAWPVKGIPTSFLIDREGRIAYRAVGGREFDAPDIVALIRQLLGSTTASLTP
jgi:thiol-disulfide isomerase/thioredoxin